MKSRELPVPPDKALQLLAHASARAMTPARSLPKPSLTRRVLLVCFYVTLIVAMVWVYLRHESLVLAALLMLVCALAFTFFAMVRRCPACKHRLTYRIEDIYGTSLYRQLYDCGHCHTVWDSGVPGDHEQDRSP